MDRINSKCLALYKKESATVDIKLFSELCTDIMCELKISPTHIGLTGIGYPKKIVSYTTGIKKLETKNYLGVESINIFYLASTSDAPAYDWLFLMGLNLRDGVEFFLGGDESIVSNSLVKKIFIDLEKNISFDYGYAFSMKYSKGPEFYVAGVSFGDLSDEESKSISKWLKDSYSKKSYFDGRLRDVYEINILTQKHMSYPLKDKLTLKDFIVQLSGTKLEQINPTLFIWAIPKDKIVEIKQKLLEYEILICS